VTCKKRRRNVLREVVEETEWKRQLGKARRR
jgi:hypothetical protein